MRAVILDRDGTINEDSPAYVKSLAEFHILPGVPEAIARLNRAGWKVFVATNQSGLARGLFDMAALNAMHQHLEQVVGKAGGQIQGIAFCPHGPDEGCDCRKPAPGLFQAIAERSGIRLEDSHAVGDSLRDLQAASLAGCQVHLVRTGNGTKTEREVLPPGTQVHDDLTAFADWLLAQNEGER